MLQGQWLIEKILLSDQNDIRRVNRNLVGAETLTRLRGTKKARVPKLAEVRSDTMKRPNPLKIDEKIEGRDRILYLKGSADILSMPAVQELLSRYGKEGVRFLLIDLSETEFINSPVWAVITLFARKRRTDSRVAIVGMSERIKGSFEMMGLQQELQTFANIETARRELQR